MTDDRLAETTATEPVGSILAKRRVARGLTLEELAAKLKFAPRQLEALENNRFDTLPRGTFLRGMVRSYARLLEIDPEPLLERIAGRIDLPDAEQLAARYSEPVPFSDASKRLNVVYAVLSVAVLVVAGAVAFEWQSSRGKPQPSEQRQAAGREAQKPMKEEREEVVSAAKPGVEPQAAQQAKEPAREPKAGDAKPAPKPAEQPVVPSAAAPSSQLKGGKVLRFKFNRESWVQVRDRTGHVLMSQLNPQGTESTVEGEPPFSLVIGNAQHVRVLYRDEPIDLAPHIKVEVARFTLP